MAVITIIGVLASLSIGKSRELVGRARVARAIEDIRVISLELTGLDELPSSLAGIGRGGKLDPWGRPYQYLLFDPTVRKNGRIDPPQGARKDRFLVPINSEFDLYSLGPDGQSVAPLTAHASRDDVIYASDGDYIGPASGY